MLCASHASDFPDNKGHRATDTFSRRVSRVSHIAAPHRTQEHIICRGSKSPRAKTFNTVVRQNALCLRRQTARRLLARTCLLAHLWFLLQLFTCTVAAATWQRSCSNSCHSSSHLLVNGLLRPSAVCWTSTVRSHVLCAWQRANANSMRTPRRAACQLVLRLPCLPAASDGSSSVTAKTPRRSCWCIALGSAHPTR